MSNKPKTSDEAMSLEQVAKWRKRLGISGTRPFPGEEIPRNSEEISNLKQQLEKANRSVEEAEARMDEAMTKHCQERARADALAETLDFVWRFMDDAPDDIMGVACETKGPGATSWYIRDEWLYRAQKALDDYRQAREKDDEP